MLNPKTTVNNELERAETETIMASFKVLCQHSSERIKECHKNSGVKRAGLQVKNRSYDLLNTSRTANHYTGQNSSLSSTNQIMY